MTMLLTVFWGLVSRTQQAVMAGKWETPDKNIIYFYREGPVFVAQQIIDRTKKDYPVNMEIIADEVKRANTEVFEGIVIDPENYKTYEGHFMVNDSGTELNIKARSGFLNFSEIWRRLN